MSFVTLITITLYAAVVLVSLLLIALVLVQPSKSGGGLGAAFGGGIGESVFGAQAGSHLTKLTVVLTTIFFVLTLMLAILVSHSQQNYKSDALDQAGVAAAEAVEVVAQEVAPAAEPVPTE